MNIAALSSFEKDVLLRKLLHVMDQQTRRQIMAEYPQIYAKMAPATKETVVAKVREAWSEATGDGVDMDYTRGGGR
jgi:magnesium-transporting ATPase (P-type)